MATVDLSRYDNSWYSPGRPFWVAALWFFTGAPLVRCSLLPGSGFRRVLLRLFGARIGQGVVIKPGVRVKYPWRLEVGDHAWIGEDCWIDNLDLVRVGSNACLSQAVYICTGLHDAADPRFGLKTRPIEFRDGSWAGAHAIIYPGVVLHEGAIATAGSVVRRDVAAWEVHAGNPAQFVKRRELRGSPAEEV